MLRMVWLGLWFI